jgi:hypothetical protein
MLGYTSEWVKVSRRGSPRPSPSKHVGPRPRRLATSAFLISKTSVFAAYEGLAKSSDRRVARSGFPQSPRYNRFALFDPVAIWRRKQ